MGLCCLGGWWCVVCWSGSGLGELATRHVRAVAETVGVSERTVWRWLERAKTTGQVEAPVRQGYAVSDEVWALLGEVGGNVAELRRRLAGRRCRRRRHCTG